MLHFIYKNTFDDINIVVVLAYNGNAEYDSSCWDQRVIVVHRRIPLKLTLLNPGDSYEALCAKDFETLYPKSEHELLYRNVRGYSDAACEKWPLKTLQFIIRSYNAGLEYNERTGEEGAVVSANKWANESPRIFKQIWDHLAQAFETQADSEESPRPDFSKCPKCKHDLQMGFSFPWCFDFKSANIKGLEYFECFNCGEAISKLAFIMGLRNVVLEWAEDLEMQAHYYSPASVQARKNNKKNKIKRLGAIKK